MFSIHSFVLRIPCGVEYASAQSDWSRVACAQGPAKARMGAQSLRSVLCCPACLVHLYIRGIFAVEELHQETNLGSVLSGALWILPGPSHCPRLRTRCVHSALRDVTPQHGGFLHH